MKAQQRGKRGWFMITNTVGTLRQQCGTERVKYLRGKHAGETAEEYKFHKPITTDERIPSHRAASVPMDIERINAEVRRQNAVNMHDAIMQAFGPRLVLPNGTAKYAFQCKKKT